MSFGSNLMSIGCPLLYYGIKQELRIALPWSHSGLVLRAVVLLAVLFMSGSAGWCGPGQPMLPRGSGVGDVVSFSELAARGSSTAPRSGMPAGQRVGRRAGRQAGRPADPISQLLGTDPNSEMMFSAASAPPSPSPSASFQALADNAVAFNPDTQGAVGPNHLMLTLGSQVRIQNRSGSAISTVSIDAFWGTIGNSNVYDPRVIYDSANQRWITTAIANPSTNGASLLIAVSQTSDPTGNWYRRAVLTDVDGVYPESPNIGLARDWILVTANMLNLTGQFYESVGVFAFNKTNFYGTGAAQYWQTNYAPSGSTLSEVNVPVPAVNFDDNSRTSHPSWPP